MRKNSLIKMAAGAACVAMAMPCLAVHAAGFAYGSIEVVPGATQGLLTYHALDSASSKLCDLATFACNPAVTSTPPAIVGEIAQGGYSLSPSGALAFVAEAGAGGAVVNNIYKVVNHTLTNPKPLPVAAPISRIIFSPDDARAVVRTATALISINLQTNTIAGTAPWTAGDYFSFAQISPNGRFVAYYSPATQSAPTRYFRLVDLVKGKTYTLSEALTYWDLLSEENVLFQFSPDSTFLIYKDDRNGPQTLYRVDLAKLKGTSFAGTRLFSKSYSVSDFLLADVHTLLYLANRADPLRFDLFSYDLQTGTLKTILTDASYYPPLHRAGNVVFVNQLVSWGSQVVAYNLNTGVLLRSPQPAADFETLQPAIDIALPGGTHGALLLPDHFDPKAPHQLVMWLHGGPYRDTSLGYHPYPSYGVYDWMLEGLRQSGVVVLKLDYHGSFGYGRPFAESLKGSVGTKDVSDVLAALGSLKSTYNLSQVHLMGVSYGGYLALRTLVERPESFASAISVNGVSDWLTLVNGNPNTIFAADFEGPLTVANQSLYDHASIWAKLPGLTSQKVVLLHSTADSEISFSQSSKLADILTSAGKHVEFTRLEGDDHVLNFRSSAMTVCNTTFRTLGLIPGDKCTLGDLR